MKKVYLDYAATTPVDSRVLQRMLPYFKEKFGNPSSVHSWGREAREAVESARSQVSQVLGCQTSEIFFTGTTTTSGNLAIQGVARAAKKRGKGNQIITSAIEHHGVLDVCRALEKEGFKLMVIPVDKHGMVNPKDVEKAINQETVLITIMYANNEMGTIQPIKEISRLVRKSNLPFHTDAAAVIDYLDFKVKNLGVDLMTFGAHKFGGPKGVGVLYLRKGIEIEPITFGGHHEKGLWPGTEAVPLIIGLGEAIKIADKEKKDAVKQVTKLGNRLIKGVLANVPNAQLTGHPTKRLPDIASFVIKGAEGEAMLLELSDQGIAASSGSACTSGILEPSHVLTAMGIPVEEAHGSLRFSLGKETTQEEVDYVIKILPIIVKKLRRMAPKGV
ncbi:MAG TPA: cysteine desulfurase family protein [Patescibacteria group bacterium]|nr:cysteine desulfurase family protein [Patescibacteria group bacterium]